METWILIILTYVYIFLCPGNDLRYATAIQKLFPGWYSLTLINKIDFVIRINKIENSELSIEKIWFIVENSQIKEKEEKEKNSK